MHRLSHPFAFIVSFSISIGCAAQQFGGNPSSLKWRQINTDTARIIFPEGLDDAGRRVASVIHELQKSHTATLGSRLRKINIVLQNQSTISNAYVGLGPYRSEFYLFAPQNSFEFGALNWPDQLSIHEYRHVEQFSNFNVGLSKAAGVLFGQQGQDFANSAAIPNWFYEGDAVFNETSLSRQGRGRLPYFFKNYQSLFAQEKRYSYMKLRNGSLQDYIPNHYDIGFLLVAYGREKYGSDFWKKVTQDAARFKPLIYPWQGAVKKYAGVSYRRFVKDAFIFFNDQWKEAKGSEPEYISPAANNNVTDYKYPYLAADGSIIVLKRSYCNIPAVYKILPGGGEEKIGIRDISNDDYFSYNNGKIVFASYKADLRWGYREFSDIKIMAAAAGTTTQITYKQRYFSPDISHGGQKVVAVEMRTNQMSNLVAMDLQGKILYRSKAARGTVYTYPKFSATDSFVYSPVRNEDGKMALIKIDLSSGKEATLLPFANRIIGFPVVQGDTVFFSSSYRGSDEIWAFIESKNKAYRVAVNPTGYYQAGYDNVQRRLIISHFTADGYRLAAIPSASLLWQPVNEQEEALPDIYAVKALEQEDHSTLEKVSVRDFVVRKYSKAFNLLNFHSWRPYYDDPEITYSIIGENVLNTLQTELSYTYNRNEGSHRAGLTAVYGGWFVQPTIGVNETWNRNIFYNADTSFYYNELNAQLGFRIPLNFSAGRQYRSLTFSSTINNQQINWTGLGKQLLSNQSFNFIEGRIQYSGQIQKAVQHIYPRWGQSLLLQYRSVLNKYSGNQFLASGYLYLPALHSNHNLVVTAAYQYRNNIREYFSNSFPFSRGYAAVDFPSVWRMGANYHLPLAYPDWGFGNIVYFKRIRANGFYDYTRGTVTGNTFSFSTAGAELFFDTKWWNQQDVSFGIRYSRLLDKEYRGVTQPNQWEIILPVGLFR